MTDLPQLSLTERAASAFKDSCDAENFDLEPAFLRIDALPGGCSGYKYGLELASPDNLSDNDVRFQSQGITLVVDRTKLIELLGPLEIDYTDDNLVEQGFLFRQENGRQCGCGESFTPYQKPTQF